MSSWISIVHSAFPPVHYYLQGTARTIPATRHLQSTIMMPGQIPHLIYYSRPPHALQPVQPATIKSSIVHTTYNHTPLDFIYIDCPIGKRKRIISPSQKGHCLLAGTDSILTLWGRGDRVLSRCKSPCKRPRPWTEGWRRCWRLSLQRGPRRGVGWCPSGHVTPSLCTIFLNLEDRGRNG